MGFVDLHCHLLWELDDGCRSPEETVAAARALAAIGYSDVAASPHVQARYAGGDRERSELRLEEARSLLRAEGVRLALHGGGENFLDLEFLARAGTREMRGVGEQGRYALVELPFQATVPELPELVAAAVAMGVTPLVAHPERCLEFLKPGRAAEAVLCGAVLQLNLGSLTGRHGQMARSLAERFFDDGLYAVGGTDLHAPDGAEDWIGEALEALATRGGEAALHRLCEDNPRRVLAGEDLT
jgi:protein-tyrosine phosphatase